MGMFPSVKKCILALPHLDCCLCSSGYTRDVTSVYQVCAVNIGMTSAVYALLMGSVGIPRSRAFSLLALSTASRSNVTPSLNRKLGFSFTPGGLLFPYHLGVAKSLQRQKFLAAGTPLAGSSAG